MSIFAVPKRKFRGGESRKATPQHKERCRSGRSGRTRNAVYGQLYRGFESLSLRKEESVNQAFARFTLFSSNSPIRFQDAIRLKKVSPTG